VLVLRHYGSTFNKQGNKQMSVKEYMQNLYRDFAFYGFTTCPLTDSEMMILFRLGYSASDAYGIGCDVSAGFYFDDAVRGLKEE